MSRIKSYKKKNSHINDQFDHWWLDSAGQVQPEMDLTTFKPQLVRFGCPWSYANGMVVHK